MSLPTPTRVLGIESSCDEMAAAVLEAGRVRSNVVRSQVEIHARYGGIVPEMAARDHVLSVGLVIREALARANTTPFELDAIAVTAGPGLIGSLLCGVEAAKGLALATGAPLIGVNHLEGHLAAAFLEPTPPEPPFVALIVSGGHTSLVRVDALGGPYSRLGQTRDDAAGEAFDKTAKLLGLGYPGGIEIDRLAQTGDRKRFRFPAAMAKKDTLDYSFSGLKTEALRQITAHGGRLDGATLSDFCASFQEAIVEALLRKAFLAIERSDTRRLVLAGGVAANRRLREEATRIGQTRGIAVSLPSRELCTDNAAMIARAGLERLRRGERDDLDLTCRSHWPL
ncbi:MAG: tRNA (adenosine(37)-N6)-threonylcarbamoyltransferase complex transferase subunit TsaD [Deltaproteobacteria bacterium]|nr:tRNA (adenosine(37)-N6)-threonylcarbamoyltransferase complex transferase subunit TsaD [Deltaproteobacteria bacterium]